MSRSTRALRAGLAGISLLALAPLLIAAAPANAVPTASAAAAPSTYAQATTDAVVLDESTAIELSKQAATPPKAAAEYCAEVVDTDVNFCASTPDELASTLLTDYNMVNVTPAEAEKMAAGNGYRTQSGAQVQALVTFGYYYADEYYGGTARAIMGGGFSQCTVAANPIIINIQSDWADSWYGYNGCAARFFEHVNGNGAATNYYNCHPELGRIGFHDRASSVAISWVRTTNCPA
jgi:hypothetical protein